MKLKLLLPAINGDSLLIEPKKNKVYFTVKCDGTGFVVYTDKWKLKELFMETDPKTTKPIRKCPKKIGMRFRR